MSECGQRTPHRAVRRRRIPYRLRPDSPPVPLVAQCQHGFRTAVEPGELRCRMQAAGELHRTPLELIYQSVDRFLEDFDDLSVAIARLRDPNDPILDWDQVCHDLDLLDQD